MSDFKMPEDTHRLLILGRTGSGKSQNGAWHLSMRRFDRMPWIIVDPKRDELLGSLGAIEIPVGKKLPKKPGLFITHPEPDYDDEKINSMFREGMENQHTGFYIDEAYSLPRYPKNREFRRILTQGRSKRVPTITLSQRPAWIDVFNFSEASHIQMFGLVDKKDRDRVNGFVNFNAHERLPDYWSHWYDVSQNASFKLQPVPSADDIRSNVRSKLGVKRRAKVF